MKKSLLLLALTAAFSGSAFAQSSSVSMYGIVDVGVSHESGPNGKVTRMDSGAASQSRIGFKGTEDLGGGTKAFFQLESGFKADTGAQGETGTFFNRQSFVGLSNAHYGTLTAGRQFDFGYETLRDVADPFAGGFAGRANNVMGYNVMGESTANLVKYVAPSIHGVTVGVEYGLGETVADLSANRVIGVTAKYAHGPLTAAVSHNTMEIGSTGVKAKGTMIAGSYDLGVAKAHVGFGTNKLEGLIDDRDLLIGVSVPVDGATRLMASYVRKTDRLAAEDDATQIGVGVVRSLSKRTDVYASYARISNDNGAAFTVGNNSEVGTGTRGFNMGVRHSF